MNNPMMDQQRRDGQGQWTDSPNRGGGGWNDPGQGGREGGGEEGRLRRLGEAARRIDPAQAKAEVDRMVASGRVSRLTVDALYRQAAALV